MALKTRAQLAAEINAQITANGSGQITGTILNAILNDIVATEVTQADTSNIVAVAPAQRTVTASGDITVLATDQIIKVNKTVAAPTNINLPTSASRNGVPVMGKDLKGDANVNNITFVPAAGETIDGFSAAAAAANGVALIDVDYAAKTLFPNVSGGWFTG